MSQRSERPAPDPDVIPLAGKVVCTDKGRHPQVRISGYMDHLEPGDAKAGWTETRQWDLIAETRPEEYTLRFRCKRCRRDVRLRESKALAAFDALRKLHVDGVPLVLDISRLPC